MIRALIALCLMAGTALADCQADFSLARAAIGWADYRIIDEGELVDADRECRLTGFSVSDEVSLRIDIAEAVWRARGLDTLPIGARIVPQMSDPWTNFHLEEQNRRSVIGADLSFVRDPGARIIGIERANVDFPGENGISLSSRVTGATLEALPGRIGEFGAPSPEAPSLVLDNGSYFDGAVLGWVMMEPSTRPGTPDAVVGQAKADLQNLVAAWRDAVFPDASKTALSEQIAAGPLPRGAAGARPLDRFVAIGLSSDPLGAEAVTAALDGAVIGVRFEPAALR